ncbi:MULTISPECIES: hypothetical protein [Sphingobacterium]|uniref:Sigma-70 family RNA polymerase sigma factor n=1 Tax=Sphingobacterium populi TaxID=1812824 RepID=A0ABW5UBT6_9SPHI|nr:hypothetical protein [Sphingobacterium sp. CFCC 11742]
MSIQQAISTSQNYVRLLNSSNERALDYFYSCYYNELYKKALVGTGDDDVSRTLVQEAFFRLWLFRSHVLNVEDVEEFLHYEIKRAVREFYVNPSEQFHRNFIQLQSYHLHCNRCQMQDVDSDESEDRQSLQDRIYIRKINALMPNIRQDQQVLIRLCLEYGFNYDRIADHLGGRSAQEVRFRVGQAIAHMRSVFENTEKLQQFEYASKDKNGVNLNPEEALVLHLRFEQHQTFDQIAEALDVDIQKANNLFVQAYRKSKSAEAKNSVLSMC